MSLSKIFKVRDAMLRVTENVGHYEAMQKDDQYIVWAEDFETNSLHVDNEKKEQVIQGTIDYFTKEDGDKNVDKIQHELKTAKITYKLNSVQNEEETGYIHYEWIWEIV